MRAILVSRLIVVVLLAVAFAVPVSGVAAQATPDSGAPNPFADLGLPQLDITVTGSAFEGVPSELAAGRYVIALTNATDDGFSGGGAFLQVPEGMTTDEFIAFVSPSDESTSAEVVEASPVADEMGPPDWYYETMVAGGPYAPGGGIAYAVVELTAGEWVFWAEYPGAPQPPVPVVVTGDLPADLPTPVADVTIEMSEFAFGMSGPIAAGPQVIELANAGEQPHFLAVIGVPPGTTVDDILALAQMESEAGDVPVASPTDEGLSFDDIVDAFGTGDQSAGVTAWYAIDLAPGTYAAVCFVTDPETGEEHVMLGMVEVFDVE